MDTQHRHAVAVVEEETPQEFYANLIGATPRQTKRRLSKGDSQAAAPAPCLQQRQQQRPHHVVPTEERILVAESNDIFNQSYQRAIKDPPKLSALSLGPSNKGFQLLHKMGWKEDEGGLGRQRQGTLTPVKTRLKMDKRGLGRSKVVGGNNMNEEARVTHHEPHKHDDMTAASAVKETRAQRRRRKRMERQREENSQKRARMLLRTDVSDEYEQLYMSLHGGGG